MENTEGTRTPQDGLNSDEAYLNTLKSHMPKLDELFGLLADGYTPNFEDILNAMSEMVAFYTDYDQTEADELLEELKMSQNKCRFCA